MKILMILQNLNFKDVYNYPVGYFYIAAVLKRAGHSVEWLEFTEKRPTINEIAAAIKNKVEIFDIKAVMCSSLFVGWREFHDVMTAVKEIDKSLITIGVGGGPTYSSDNFMKFIPALDICVLGEAEIITVNLMNAIQNKDNLNTVKGIVYRDEDGKVNKNAPGEYEQNLDSLPYPLFSPEFEKIIHQAKYALVAGSRSCPYNCTFCCYATSKKYRKRAIDNIVAEVKFYKDKYGIQKVWFIDELLADNLDRIHEFCDKIAPIGIKFIFQIRASKNFSADLFKRLINAGMESFSFGVENLNDEILESMQKKTNVALLEHCFDALKDSGANILTKFNLIIGDPAETIKTFSKTIRFLRENYKNYKLVSPLLLKCYPGSQIYNDAVKNNIIDPDNFFDICGYTVPIVNITKLSNGCFEAINMTTLYERVTTRDNDDLEVQIYTIDDKYHIKWRCNCCDENIWRTKQLGDWLEYTRGTEITFICSFCDKIIVDIVKSKYYNFLGSKLSSILQKRKIMFYGVNEVMRRLLDFIWNYDFTVTAHNLKFSADDWRVIENELYENNIMSDMIENKFISKLSSVDLCDMDMVVVVSVDLFETAKQEINALNLNLPVIMYSDLLYV